MRQYNKVFGYGDDFHNSWNIYILANIAAKPDHLFFFK